MNNHQTNAPEMIISNVEIENAKYLEKIHYILQVNQRPNLVNPYLTNLQSLMVEN